MVAHLLNVEWLNNSRQGVYDKLSTALSALEDGANTSYLNPVRKTDIVSPKEYGYHHPKYRSIMQSLASK